MQSSRLPDTMSDKYRIVPRAKDGVADGEVRVCSLGSVPRYVDYTERLFNEKNLEFVVIKATGSAIPSAINVAEVTKRRFLDLHQLNNIGVSRTVDTFEPTETGVDKISYEREVPYIEITLSKNVSLLDVDAPGYQPPLDPSQLNAESPTENSDMRSGRGSVKETEKGHVVQYQQKGGYRRNGNSRGTQFFRGNSYRVASSYRSSYRRPNTYRGSYRGSSSYRGGYRGISDYRGRDSGYRGGEGGYRAAGEGGYRATGEGVYRATGEGGYRGGEGGYRGGEGGYRGGEGGYRGGEGGYRGGESGYRGGENGYRAGENGYRGAKEGPYRGGKESGYRGGKESGYREGGYRERGSTGIRASSYANGMSRGGIQRGGRRGNFARSYRGPVSGGPRLSYRGRGGPTLLYEPKLATTS